MSSVSKPIGIVYRWGTGRVDIVISDQGYRPGIGDLLYCKVGDRYVLLQVSGYSGEIPINIGSMVSGRESKPPLYNLETSRVARADLFFEIKKIDDRLIVIKPYQPPPLSTPVYRLIVDDPISSDIMKMLSIGIRSDTRNNVPIAWLRSGIAPARELRREKYFIEATLDLDLRQSIPKHILVSGQTGAGKTTSIMGIIVQWARYGREKIGWLIIDRHGEYCRIDNNGFAELLRKTLSLNKLLDTMIYIFSFRLTSVDQDFKQVDKLTRVIGTIDLTSVNVYDVANALDLPPDKASDLEEVVDILSSLIRLSNSIKDEWKKVFINDDGEATGQVLALLTLLVDNLFRFEGVGETGKYGVYKVLLNAGLDIRKLRTYRRALLSLFGFKLKKIPVPTKTTYGSGEREVSVSIIDDNESVFKVSPLLKDPYAVVEIMKGMVEAAKSSYNVNIQYNRYPWWGVESKSNILVIKSGDIDIGDVVDLVNKGNLVILDVSKIPLSQGDTVIQSVIRRLFESRINLGVEQITSLPPIAIVSEEAPLYLSPEKVRSPYNVFARIAREGRKFGIGLIAITQLATMIERQILANFNTIIALRTKYVSDINYYVEIGVPGEALTSLGDREGYLYTPDLRVKEPIPVYIPGYFELAEEIEREYGDLRRKEEEALEGGVSKLISSLKSMEEDEE
ncbi:MAG: hypothetical protein B6U89_04260 [Desulfurococcales archaeon ex4484_58]|nr:MAG: hypothetical protein B6U89_04260 [Desulfurococcales archaeon ex4484_58]